MRLVKNLYMSDALATALFPLLCKCRWLHNWNEIFEVRCWT